MKFNNLRIIFAIIVFGIFVLGGCTQKIIQPDKPILKEPEKPVTGTLKVEPILLAGIDTEKTSLTKHYSLDAINIELKTSQYNLPLKTSEISNYADFSGKIQLNSGALGLLSKNGFVIIRNPFYEKEEDITQPYNTLKDKEIPIFVTTDSLLHLYHIQFDETLRQIEEREFFDAIFQISNDLLKKSEEQYNNADGEIKEALKRNVAYFAVGLKLLQPKEEQTCQEKYRCYDGSKFEKEELSKYAVTIPSFVKNDVDKELDLIEKHSGFSESPIFKYKEDYSQYVPRGHYTRSEKLQNYFKAMMWYGRISFLLKKGAVSEEDARLQTIGASLIASEFANNKGIKEKWDRIYTVTAFYVGLSDDLGPYEYIEALNSVFGSSFNPNDLNVDTIGKLKAKLAEFQTPKIYGGTGSCQLNPPFTSEQANECLESTKGFRLMGQRFIPDSYMMSEIVFPYSGQFTGTGNPFTMIVNDAGKVRGFPRGLDVMALLGSKRAAEILKELGDSEYNGYDKVFTKLEEEFSKFSVKEWNKNLYWSWLYALKPLLKEYDSGYPTFMQTKAWQDKSLTSALASWSELRHDTILYAKQSYTVGTTSIHIPPPEKPVVGYVEPVPEFYNRLLALTKMTNKGLDEMNVLDAKSKSRLKNLQTILERLVEISKQELENKELSQEDYDFIKNFGKELNGVIADVEDKAKKTTIIADVHTDINTGQVLEEGVGYVDFVIVAYKVPDGRILIGAGPIMTYYEFKHPMSDRLTDEKWREMLSQNPPEKPEWTVSFIS